MALSILRQGLQVGRAFASGVRLMPVAVSVHKQRTITSKQFRKENPDKPKPWPYEDTKFTSFDSLFDDTQDRFDENSKIIVIDGNVGVGKSHLAKRLAEELDFLLFPEANLDMKYIDDEGFDLRSLNHLFPDTVRPYDIKSFYANPTHLQAKEFQYSMFALRFEQYCDALAHLTNTGQGIILERSVWSDFVFMEAMHKSGYVDDYDLEIYNKMKKNARIELLKPHVVIYLDAPIPVLMDRIKKRGLDYELNTSVLTPEYLETIDRRYKEDYLPYAKKNSEVICYDWSTFGDPLRVIEDLERLTIDEEMEDPYSEKFKCWKGRGFREWNGLRIHFTNLKDDVIMSNVYSVFRVNRPEFNVPPEDINEYNAIFQHRNPHPYENGFNEGDAYHFRIDSNYRDEQRFEFYRTR